MLKSYEELSKIDVSKYCKERDGIEYLNWAVCIKLLHENGAEKVYFEPIPDPVTGSSLRMSQAEFVDKNGVKNRCYETEIKVVVDENTWIMRSPVLNGTNPVKDNSMNQLRVWNSMCRSFVKCIAIHTGLGFNLWVGEEEGPNIPTQLEVPAKPAEIKVIQNLCAQNGVDGDMWVASNGKSWDTLTGKEAAVMLVALKKRYGDD